MCVSVIDGWVDVERGGKELRTGGIHTEKGTDETQRQENNGNDGECIDGRVVSVFCRFDFVFTLCVIHVLVDALIINYRGRSFFLQSSPAPAPPLRVP